MIELIKNITPPILLNLYKKYSGYFVKPLWEYLPNGFNTKIRSDGWDVQSIVDLQVSKWNNFASSINSIKPLGINHESNYQNKHDDLIAHNTIYSYSYVLMLAFVNKDSINILDWGGGIGHYGLISESLSLNKKNNLKYHCYDLEKFCIAGKKISPNYIFYNSKDLALSKKYDLILVSSSLWYEKDWKKIFLDLSKSTSNYLYITRMIFITRKPSYVAIQRPHVFGYNTEYMCWILNESEFIEYAVSIGLELIRETYIGPGYPIFKAPENGDYKGFIFKKNNSAKTNSDLI